MKTVSSIRLLWFALLFGAPLQAQNLTLSEDFERFMVLQLSDGIVLTDDFIVFEEQDHWMFPLTAFSKEVQFNLEVSALHGEAKGYFINETNEFEFSLKQKILRIKGESQELNLDLIIVKGNEIYVSQSELAK